MRTTITQKGDRRGGVLNDRDHNEILDDARMILADLSALLREHIEEIRTSGVDPDDRKIVDARLRELSNSLVQVLGMEAKTLARAGLSPPMDMEAVRAEIESRLDRLAAAGAA